MSRPPRYNPGTFQPSSPADVELRLLQNRKSRINYDIQRLQNETENILYRYNFILYIKSKNWVSAFYKLEKDAESKRAEIMMLEAQNNQELKNIQNDEKSAAKYQSGNNFLMPISTKDSIASVSMLEIPPTTQQKLNTAKFQLGAIEQEILQYYEAYNSTLFLSPPLSYSSSYI